jgi:hypothetical protein
VCGSATRDSRNVQVRGLPSYVFASQDGRDNARVARIFGLFCLVSSCEKPSFLRQIGFYIKYHVTVDLFVANRNLVVIKKLECNVHILHILFNSIAPEGSPVCLSMVRACVTPFGNSIPNLCVSFLYFALTFLIFRSRFRSACRTHQSNAGSFSMPTAIAYSASSIGLEFLTYLKVRTGMIRFPFRLYTAANRCILSLSIEVQRVISFHNQVIGFVSNNILEDRVCSSLRVNLGVNVFCNQW